MENILAQAAEVAEEAEVFTVTSEETQVKFETNRLKQLQTKQQTSVALRIVRQGKIGYATTTEMSDCQGLVSNAVETAQFGMPARFQLPALLDYPQVEVFDASVESVPNGVMIKLGEELITAVTGHTPDIVCEAEVSRGVVSVRIMNSRGGQSQYRKSLFSLGIEGTLINGTDMLFVGESEDSCHPILESRTVAGVVLRQLELAENQASVPTRSLPVIFTPNGVASALLMPLMAAFNGKTDEGVPSQRTTLIEEGKVVNFLYDLQTAALAHARSTGNGSRGHGGLPAPSPSAFVVAPGKVAFSEMVRDMEEGLVIEQLMGAEQGNILGGDFSGNVLLGYKVENGKIVGRIKDTMVSGNVYQVLKDITAIGNEAKWVGGFLQTPHIYCPGLSVASRG